MRIAEKSERTTREKGEFLMKHKARTKALSWLLSLALALSLLPGMGLTAQAANTYSLVPAYGQSGATYSITPSEDTLAAVKTALAAEMSLDTETKEIWLYADNYGYVELDNLSSTMYYKVKSKPQEIVAGKTYVIGDSLYFEADKYYNNGAVQTGSFIFGPDVSKAQEFYRFDNFDSRWSAKLGSIPFVCEEPSGHTFNSSEQPIGFKLADDSGDGSSAQNYIKFEAVYAERHNFTYTATSDTITATCSADDCTLTNKQATLTLKPPANLVYSGSAKEATVEGTIPDVETPSIKYIGRGNTAYNESTTAPTATGDYTASVTLGEKTASVDFTIKDASYTITIPAKLTVENAGWNATAGVTASGEIAEDTKLTVTAASANEWALKSGENTVSYYLTDAEDGKAMTAWDFTAEELSVEGGTSKTMGAVVEEYINKPAGDYADTVTFTAEIRSLLNTITIDGTELIYADGDTWAQIVERNPQKIRIAGSSNNRIWRAQDNPLYIGGRTPVLPTDTIDPSLKYGFEAD